MTPLFFSSYDALHRLLSETSSGASQAQDVVSIINHYDSLVPKHAVKETTFNGADYSYDYDANGNMISGWDFDNPASIGTRTLSYNAENMPSSITSSGTSTELLYDGDGTRAKKTADGTSTYYVSGDYEVSGGLATRYIFAGDLRIAMQSNLDPTDFSQSGGAETFYFHKDHLGSSSVMTDSIGSTWETTEYLPFGGERSHTGDFVSNYRFTDQEKDSESNLYNYDARLYDPVIGLFISADSIVPDYTDPQSLNRFAYVRNNPLRYEDPTGHRPVDEMFNISTSVFGDFDFDNFMSEIAYATSRVVVYMGMGGDVSVKSIGTLSHSGGIYLGWEGAGLYRSYGESKPNDISEGWALDSSFEGGFMSGGEKGFFGYAQKNTGSFDVIGFSEMRTANGDRGYEVNFGGWGHGAGYYTYETNTEPIFRLYGTH